MLLKLRHVAKRFKTPVIIYHVYDNWRVKRRFRAGNPASMYDTTHAGKPLSYSLPYINEVFNDYLRCSGLHSCDLADKRILEVGPGDNLGVALRFVATGAKQVVCVDKFLPASDQVQHCEIYRALRDTFTIYEQAAFDSVVNLEGGVHTDQQRLLHLVGVPIEQAAERFEPASFDLIVSRAVLEHVYDLDAAFAAMDCLLAPGGYMVHKVDFRDHGLFSSSGQHPLTFFTIPDQLYKLMAYDSGKPNRRLIDYYRRKLAELGYEFRVYVTHIVGIDTEIAIPQKYDPYGAHCPETTRTLIESIRPRLQREFRLKTVQELAVAGIFLIARKAPRETSDSSISHTWYRAVTL